jgi:hypothetical protein
VIEQAHATPFRDLVYMLNTNQGGLLFLKVFGEL